MRKKGETDVLVFVIVGLIILAIFFLFIYKTREGGCTYFETIKQEIQKIFKIQNDGTTIC